jgi:hypothetical protein
MEGRILFLGRELQAAARLEGPEGLKGRVDVASPAALPADVTPYTVVVLDLDEVGVEPLASLRAAGYEGRVVGFYSHVDEALGERAQSAGIEVHRRGRFWRQLAEILT